MGRRKTHMFGLCCLKQRANWKPGVLYLSMILDFHDNSIVAYKLEQNKLSTTALHDI